MKTSKMIKPLSIGKTAKLFKEANDCTVRALANAAGMEYEEAHEILKNYGRKNASYCPDISMHEAYLSADFCLFGIFGTTTAAKQMKNTLDENGSSYVHYKGTTLNTLLNSGKFNDGSYIFVNTQHAFAVVDGEVIDNVNYVPGGMSIVAIYYLNNF